MDEYDITAAFEKIEEELIASMLRNMDHHRAQEEKEGLLWSQWQTEQLKALERYKLQNQKKYSKQFRLLNNRVEELIRAAHQTGNMEQEIEILEAIKNGFNGYHKMPGTMQAEFFRLNERKLEALIQATTNDMQKAETAVLRMANDQYQKTIFNAQVYANSGAGTYTKAVDMATKDMLAAGLNCIQYANGARHTLPDYADMAIRTASKRAYLQGEGEKRQEWGIATVILNKRGNPCPKCLPFCGKVLIDDVWSGGKAGDRKYPLMSYAISQGLYHPRCKDTHTTYFPGISTADDTWTKEELEKIGLENEEEAKQQYAERQTEKYERMANYSLDEEDKRRYKGKAEDWASRSVREYRVESADGGRITFQERNSLKRVVSELPPRVADALKDVTIRLRSRAGSGYDPLEKVIYLAEGASRREVIHEIGHVLEEKIFDVQKIERLKKKITQGLMESDIIIRTATDSGGNKRSIFLLDCDRFINAYQSRLYVDDASEAVNPDGTIKTDVLGEFVSVAVEHYFMFPGTLRKWNREMYDMVEEALR